ncbi:MAG: hypothetical protein GWO24_30705, partial [Akkermansiaceae bacterium]|nr:hypothetical protein [Akkermansiaceae bacterium]
RLASYTLELEPLPAGSGPRLLLASGTTPVTGGELGTVDPTLHRNGAYHLILRAETTTGLAREFAHPIVIDGNMKIGHFALAFDDLSVPLSGLPLTVTRSYDSRDPAGGDFGPGWSVGLRSVSIRKTRPLGQDWEQQLSLLPFKNVYTLFPVTRKR